MSDDWVKNYMDVHKQRVQRQDDDLLKAQHTQRGAQKTFERLCHQIQADIVAFHQHGGDPTLRYQGGSIKEFQVRRATYPAVTLDVKLNGTTIDYELLRRFDDTSSHEKSTGSLRLWANLQGAVQVYKNGTPFSDESEVSELLLKPLFEYIYSH